MPLSPADNSRHFECSPRGTGREATALPHCGRCWTGLLLLALFVVSGCAWCRKSTADNPTHIRHCIDQALAAQDRGDITTAEELLTDAVEDYPDNGELRWELARLLLEKGDNEAAVVHLRHLVANDPDDCRGYSRLAHVLYCQHRYADADRLITLALQMDPKYAEALVLKGKLDEIWGEDDRALEAYHRVLQHDPYRADAVLRIAAIHARQGRLVQAAPLLRLALEQGTQIPPERRREMQWLLGRSYAQSERWPEAVEALAAALPEKGRTADQLYQLAYARYRAGDLEGALRDAEEALQRQPRHGPSELMFAQLNQRLGPSREIAAPGHSAPELIPARHIQANETTTLRPADLRSPSSAEPPPPRSAPQEDDTFPRQQPR